MPATTEQIRDVVHAAREAFLKISPEMARQKASAEDWTKNEVLGHLIDSTANNHQRIVRGAQNAALEYPMRYDQLQWVAVQRYNDMDWGELIDLFTCYNLHLCRVVDGLPAEAFDNLCNIGRENPVTLRFVWDDYLRHLKVHVAQILGTVA